MSNSNVKKTQLEDQLLSGQGFDVSRDELTELFVSENIHNESESNSAITVSLAHLQRLGFADSLLHKLKTNASAGIDGSPNDLAGRVQAFGANKRHQRKIRTVCDMICEVFEDFILRVLCVAAVVGTTLGVIKDGWAHGFQEGVGIVIAILIIVLVTVINDYSKEKQFQDLMAKSDVTECKVRRGETWKQVDSEELVVGDIIEIGTGETVPADCLVLESNDCTASEAALTGEPDGLPKEACSEMNMTSRPDPFMLQSSLCEKGTAKALVLAVGDNTNQGKAGLTMNIENESTPLQKKLDRIAAGIGYLGMIVAVLTFIAILIQAIVTVVMDDQKEFDMDFVSELCNGLIISITVVVVAVPEGLPLAVTISLAYSVGKMYKENNLVRKLHSSETMGNANEICTDKTGTLTQNKMTVQSCFVEGQVMNGEKNTGLMQLSSSDDIQKAVIFNSTAFIQTEEDGKDTYQGNVTEVGLIKYLTESQCPTKDQIMHRDSETPVFTIPFSSARKRATTAVSMDGGNRIRVFCKGAPEIVINYCTNYIGENGQVQPMTEQYKNHCTGKIQLDYAKQCLRTLLVAHVDYTKQEWDALASKNNGWETTEDMANVEAGMTMVAIFGLKDPLRDGIRKAVEKCHKAGINVRMVTGDNIDTARAISLEAGIITQEDLNEDAEDAQYVCMTGQQFREAISGEVKLEEQDKEVDNDDGTKETKKVKQVVCKIGNMNVFRKVDAKLKVMARSQPDDKFMLVDGLIKVGKTVAVTGDGTNDAPALNRSDVGFAMGITGTDVAKNACDIQLMDDNFCSILTAVTFGRNIYDNIRKFLQFQLTVNVVAMFLVFAGACLFGEEPLTAVQLLWVNLIMDTFAALALATEPPAPSVLDRKPAQKSDVIVNGVMWRNILGQALLQITVLLVLMYKVREIFGIEYEEEDPFYPNAEDIAKHPERTEWVLYEPTAKVEGYTIVFQTFVFMQLFNQINARKLGEKEYNVFANFFNNFMFIFIIVLTFAVQMLIVEFGGRYMRAYPLSMKDNGICAAIASFTLVWGLILKCIPARWFDWIRLEEKEMTEQEEQESMVASLKKSRTMRSASQRSSVRGSKKKVSFAGDDNYSNSINK